MNYIKEIIVACFCFIMIQQYGITMDGESSYLTSGNSKSAKRIARFVLHEKDTEKILGYIENPQSPLFFKLVDSNERQSHILFIAHNQTMESNHPEIFKIFEYQTSKLVWENKDTNILQMIQELDAEANPSTQLLPEDIYEEMKQVVGADTANFLKTLKPWAAFGLYSIEKNRQSLTSSQGALDHQWILKAKGKQYPIDGLQTEADVARALGLPNLSNDEIIKLYHQEKLLSSPEEAIYSKNLEISLSVGDLIGIEEHLLEIDQISKSLFNQKTAGRRNEIWVPEIKRYHSENNGGVFFIVGDAHAVGPKGLLYLLRDGFKIERLTQEGKFLPFEYLLHQ